MILAAPRAPAFQPRHVVVIGAGAVGVCCAAYLRRDGHAVTVIDPGEPGDAASKGNGGIIATNMCVPVATPQVLRRVPWMLLDREAPLRIRWRHLPRLAPWLARFVLSARPASVERISRELAGLLGIALDSYAPLLQFAGAGGLIQKLGWLHVFEHAHVMDEAAATVELQRRCGIRVERLDGPALREREPALAPAIAGGYHYPDCAHTVDPQLLVRTLAEAFARSGGRILRARVDGLELADGRVRALRVDADVGAFDDVVIAAGAWSRGLARAVGADVPLDTERGYHLMLPDPGVALRGPLVCGGPDFGITPMRHGIRLAGTVELADLDAPPDPRRSAMLFDMARRILPGLRDAGAEPWMGFRPSLPDSKPVIGVSPRAANAYLAFGHGHLGVTMAAATGRLVADLVAARTPPIDLASFAPGRRFIG
jgi:D-amino-acid dehydrogenase